MNIWKALASLEGDITDSALRTEWARMITYRTPAHCRIVQDIADELPESFLYWKLAYRAEELAEIEQSFAREIIKVKK